MSMGISEKRKRGNYWLKLTLSSLIFGRLSRDLRRLENSSMKVFLDSSAKSNGPEPKHKQRQLNVSAFPFRQFSMLRIIKEALLVLRIAIVKFK